MATSPLPLPFKRPKCLWCNRIMEAQGQGFRCPERSCWHWENPMEGVCYCPNCDREREANGKPPYSEVSMSPVYFRIEAHKGYQAGAGVITTILSDLEFAKLYKRSLIEQQGYLDSEIQITTTDRDGRAIQY